MILFVWSLVAGAINSARRGRLARICAEHFENDSVSMALVMRPLSQAGLSKVMSAPVVGCSTSLLYRTETFEIGASRKARQTLLLRKMPTFCNFDFRTS